MPIELEVIRASEFVRLGANGSFDRESTREVLYSLIAACRKRGVSRGLIDTRSARSDLSPNDLAALVGTLDDLRGSQPFRLAILHGDDQEYRAKLFAFIGALRGQKVGAFDTYEQAVDWLSHDDAVEPELDPETRVPIYAKAGIEADDQAEQRAGEEISPDVLRLPQGNGGR